MILLYPKFNQRERTYVIKRSDGGIDIDNTDNYIDDNKSPNMLNMIFDGVSLRKREGQECLFYDENIISCFKEEFYGYIIYHSKDKLRAYNINTKEISDIYIRLSQNKGVFFSYNGFLYYIGTGEYYKISFVDDSLKCEIAEGYIPIVYINCDINGLGDENEKFNFLTRGFKVRYNTNGDSKFYIPGAPLDSDKGVTVRWQNGYLTKFEIDYNSGLIEFEKEFSEGHNMLEITAYSKEGKEDREKITNCKWAETFGGTYSGINDGTRIFVAGNKQYGNTFFYSDLRNPEYFPINQFDILGDTKDDITCMGKQYNSLVFFKEKSIYISSYLYDNNEVNFSVSLISDIYGCDCPDTLVSIDNQLVWLDSVHGCMTLYSTNIKSEKNIKIISGNINGTISKNALLNQKNLNKAVGFIHNQKYYIVTEKYTYVLNMVRNFSINIKPENMAWFLFDNISANCVCFIANKLYIGGKRGFTFFSDVLYDIDKETPIKAFYETKTLDFNNVDCFKYINSVSFYLRAVNNSYVKISFTDENGRLNKVYEYMVNKFNFINFAFGKFTFYDNLFSIFLKRKISRRRCKFFMLRFENDKENSGMCISEICINYSIERGARYNGI